MADSKDNSGREIGIPYVYDQSGNTITYSILDGSGNAVPELPIGAGTVAISPSTVTGVTLISENFVVNRIAA